VTCFADDTTLKFSSKLSVNDRFSQHCLLWSCICSGTQIETLVAGLCHVYKIWITPGSSSLVPCGYHYCLYN